MLLRNHQKSMALNFSRFMIFLIYLLQAFSRIFTKLVSSSGSKIIPFSGVIKSNAPMYLLATTGQPYTNASFITAPKGSYLLGKIKNLLNHTMRIMNFQNDIQQNNFIFNS